MMSSRGLIIALCVLVGLLAVLMTWMGKKPDEHKTVQEPTVAEQRRGDLLRLSEAKAKNWQLDANLKTVVTDSGLKYQDVSAGGGSSPKSGDQVLVDYVGWSTDGKIFDTSLKADAEPLSFILGKGNVIKGWDEGILTMKIGGIRRLVIPPDLGYGAIGAPPVIMPNQTLVFMVRLIDVRPGGK